MYMMNAFECGEADYPKKEEGEEFQLLDKIVECLCMHVIEAVSQKGEGTENSEGNWMSRWCNEYGK